MADTFQEQVNEIVSKATVDDKGNFQLPDGVEASEEVLYAAKLEKRFRDTQSAFTKSQQENKRLSTENERLAMSWEQDAVQHLSAAEQARLEELKTTDPDSWRQEITELEEAKRNQFKEKRDSISKEASQMTELELREQQLEEFNKANPEIQITDELIENDIPPRITRKLENGEITFADFLGEVKEFLGKGKAIQQPPKPNEEPDFNGAQGGQKPSEVGAEGSLSEQYQNTIF